LVGAHSPCLLLACCRPLPQSRRRSVVAGHLAKRPCGQWAEALWFCLVGK
jgi:hypothetical protein